MVNSETSDYDCGVCKAQICISFCREWYTELKLLVAYLGDRLQTAAFLSCLWILGMKQSQQHYTQ